MIRTAGVNRCERTGDNLKARSMPDNTTGTEWVLGHSCPGLPNSALHIPVVIVRCPALATRYAEKTSALVR